LDEPGSRSTGESRARRLWLAAAATGAGVVWAGCSVEKHYELLSFFFDGVPNPNLLPVLAASGDPAAIRLSPTYTAHEPFIEQRCDACHGQRFDMTAVGAEVCFECHQGVQDAYPFMHGPVVVGVCLWCHVPHESAYPALLKSDGRSVCTQCHEPGLLSVDRVPEHADESASCVDCHVGHGSEDRFLLRKDRPPSGGAGAGLQARGEAGNPEG
jgi:predicted CXXCH cytochrome family protein